MVVAGFAEVGPAVDWLSRPELEGHPRVTFVHVIDTAPFLRGLETMVPSLVELIVDAERDGTRILDMLRTAAPESMSVTTRLLKAPQSKAEQVLKVIPEVPCCDAVVICTPVGAGPLGDTARMVRRLRSRSLAPVVVLDGAWPRGPLQSVVRRLKGRA